MNRDEKGRFAACTTTRGFKGFCLDGSCQNMRYTAGGTFKVNNKKKLQCCTDSGLHFCIEPEDTWNYYTPICSKYAEVTALGKCVSSETNYSIADSKRATKKLSIGSRFYSALEFAKRFFKPAAKAMELARCSLYTESGYTHGRDLTVGVADKQCLESDYAVISVAGSSVANGKFLAFAFGSGSIAQSEEIAIGMNCLSVANKRGGVAITNEYASGVLGSRLVFLYRAGPDQPIKVYTFLVDGKKVLPGVRYGCSVGKLYEVVQ